MNKRFYISFVIAFVLALFIVGIAIAYSTTKTGTLDNRTWTATLGIKDKTSSSWTAYAEARMNPEPRDTKVVGWYWWTRREWCGGTIVYQRQHDGYQDTTPPITYAYQQKSDSYHTTCSDHYLSSFARFDFKSGGQSTSPQFEHKERRSVE